MGDSIWRGTTGWGQDVLGLGGKIGCWSRVQVQPPALCLFFSSLVLTFFLMLSELVVQLSLLGRRADCIMKAVPTRYLPDVLCQFSAQ